MQKKCLLKVNKTMMLTTWNITSRIFQGSYYIKNTNLYNEEWKAKPSTPRYLIKRPNQNNQNNLSKESSSTL